MTNWKVLREMGTQTIFSASWEAGHEATVRTLDGTTDWFKIKQGVWQGCLLSPCLFNLYAEHIMRNAGLDKLQDGIKIGGRNINSLRYVDDTTLLLLRVKEESEWAGLKLVSQKLRSWHLAHYCMSNRRGKGGSREFLLGSKVTSDDDCGHEIRRQLLLGRKAVTSLDSVLKSRDITLPTKVHIVKATVFPVVLL